MKKLKKFGFFQELEHGEPEGESINSFMRDAPLANSAKIVEYLKSGELLIACPGVAHDVLDKSKPLIGSPSVLTDGVWAWPGDLSYYVGKYNLDIPQEMEQNMATNGWQVPKQEIDVLDLELL